MKLYRTIMSKYAKGANAKDVGHVYGMAVAYETVKVLKAAGKTPTRAAVVAQTRKLNDASNPFLLPGIAVKTTRHRALPDRAGAAAALVEGKLGRASAASGSPANRVFDMEALLEAPLDELLAAARERRRGGGLVTYSPKVFIPLTKLCRDVCGYCTFARPPRRGERAYLTEEEVLAIARAGAAAGCTEALFTLGDKPELRYRVARDELRRSGARRRSSTWAVSRSSCWTKPACCRT